MALVECSKNMTEFDYLKNMTERSLLRYLPTVEKYSEIIYESMKYSLLAGGKRIRPVLLLGTCALCGGDYDEALPFACAIEFIHTYSLIHDDHPSMDNDDLRRGKPTNHVIFGDDIAILAGDGLLNSAFDVMISECLSSIDISADSAAYSSEDSASDSAPGLATDSAPGLATDLAPGLACEKSLYIRKIRAMREISEASGVHGMIAGQTADVINTGNGSLGSSNARNGGEVSGNARSGGEVSGNAVLDDAGIENPENGLRAAANEDAGMPKNEAADMTKEEKEKLLLYIHKNKTGAIIRAAVRAGAILGGASEEVLALLTEYAENIGLAFQISDDILDEVSDSATLGKTAGKDRKMDKLTYPAVFGIEESRRRLDEATKNAINAAGKASKMLSEEQDGREKKSSEVRGGAQDKKTLGMQGGAQDKNNSDFLVKMAIDLKNRIS